MSGTFHMTVGNKGRVVLPADVRARHNWAEGSVLIAVETADGVLLVERSELLKQIQAKLSDTNILEELFAERRAEAAREDRGES
ncbi:hypothetical protein GCM10022286_22070 [Gryllotalpicola daejeonensis]|uniref:SpoVT-AbrB domain-containing protein n=1 Tax=Gryllotalpicola daejeonensis TaxID=993087 RepID=A0ABP7ZL88_9MICO